MKRYDSYKDSGVEWIGEIPSGWKSKRFSYSFDIQKGKIPRNLTDFKTINSLPYLSMEVLRGGEPSEFSNEDNVVKVNRGDIGLLWDGSNSGEIVLINRDGILSSTVSLLSVKDKLLSKDFSYYLLKFYENDFKNNTIGMGIPHVSGDHVRESKIILPPLSEQQQIVSYLDTKTSLIDSLIEKTQQKIELLKEKRTSLINEVVTKGLNPNVEMKDSGVEWIGEIPSHYEVVKLKYVCSVTTGGKDTQDRVEDGQYPFYVRSPKIERINSYSYDGESVLTVGDGVGVGKVFHYVNGKFEFHQRVYKFSDFRRLTGKFFFWFIKHHFIFVTEDQNSKSTVDSLRRPLIDEFPFVIPSTSEQQQIVEYLDDQTQLIDKTISIEEKRIELLKEYRQSLISEVVTGKLKVTTDE